MPPIPPRTKAAPRRPAEPRSRAPAFAEKMQKEPPHLTQVQRLFYIDSRFRTLRGRFRQLGTALRRQGCGDPPSAGGGPHGRPPCMAFLPSSGGVFRLSLLGVMAVYLMQTVMLFSRCGAGFCNKKIATQQPEPDHPFRDGLGSGLLCSDKKVKNLLRLLREPSWNSKINMLY